MGKAKKAEVTELVPLRNEDALATMQQKELKTISWEQVQVKVKEDGGEIVTVKDITGDFKLVETESLVGKAFGILHYDTRPGDFNRDYVSVYVEGLDTSILGDRLVFNDGGTGILPVLQEFTEQTGRTFGMLVEKGIRSSTYCAKELGGCGKQIAKCECAQKHPATTNYLD